MMRPNPDDVAHNIYQPRQGKITCLNRPSQGLSRLHPITMLSTFESGHDELSHRKRIDRPEHSGSSLFLAAFGQPDIKSWIIQHSAHTPASQILLVALNKVCDPPEIDTKDNPLSIAHRTCPRMTSSLLTSPG